MNAPDRNLADAFQELIGRQPEDKEIQELLRVQKALGLRNNDALWLVLMALQHYNTLYEKYPELIAKSLGEAQEKVQKMARAAMELEANATLSILSESVASVAQKVATNTTRKQAWKWMAIGIGLAAVAVIAAGWGGFSQGKDAGFALGSGETYARMRDEKAAAAWANTPEGQVAYRLAQVTNIRGLAECSNPGWHREGKSCFVKVAPDGNIYGWQLP